MFSIHFIRKIPDTVSGILYYSSLGNFLKNSISIGNDTREDKKYAIGWHTSIPLMPKKLGKIRHRGIYISPLCRQERTSALPLFPMLWKTDPTVLALLPPTRMDSIKSMIFWRRRRKWKRRERLFWGVAIFRRRRFRLAVSLVICAPVQCLNCFLGWQ